MRITIPISISGASILVPEGRQPISLALAQGTVTAAQASACDVDSLPVAVEGQTAPLMALEVGLDALAAAGIRGRDIDFLLHSCMADTSTDWKMAPWLARMLGAKRATAVGVRQMSNGGAMAVQLAAAHLAAEPRANNCLVLTADALGPDSTRRWQIGVTGAPLGDGATALVLSRGQGELRVRSMASSGRPDHELTFPDDNPLLAGPSVAEERPEVLAGLILLSMRRCFREAVINACDDADIKIDDPRLDAIMFPRVSLALVKAMTNGVIPSESPAEIVHLPQATGHLFTGDLTANIWYLMNKRPMPPGSLGLIINVGSGFNVTCMIVEREAE